jgi:hypothetical protein
LPAVGVEDAGAGVALIIAGVAATTWSTVADTYDDRLEDRSLDRVSHFGWRDDPRPITRARRVAGVIVGIAMVSAGAWWLVTGWSGWNRQPSAVKMHDFVERRLLRAV